MRVRVTEFHIAMGKRSMGESCPVALALKDAGFDHAVVDYSGLVVRRDGEILRQVHSRKTGAWLISYDLSRCKAKPFEFELEVEDEDSSHAEVH